MDKIQEMLTKDQLEAENELDGDVAANPLEIVCLGTGKGATTLLTGEPSSSFVVMYEGKPLLIVDLGFGVVQSFRNYIGKDVCFNSVYITHNHGDHAAELPVILAVVCGMQKLPVVYAAPEVMYRLRTQRLTEVTSSIKLEELVELKTCETGSQKTPITEAGGKFSLSVLPSQHSETCYGFILYQDDVPVLSYSGDSGFNRNLYDQLLIAPNVIIDARANSSYEHAGFLDVMNYLRDKKLTGNQIFVTGYGTESEYPADGLAGVTQLVTGQKYSLHPARMAALVDGDRSKSTRTNVTADYILSVETVH